MIDDICGGVLMCVHTDKVLAVLREQNCDFLECGCGGVVCRNEWCEGYDR